MPKNKRLISIWSCLVQTRIAVLLTAFAVLGCLPINNDEEESTPLPPPPKQTTGSATLITGKSEASVFGRSVAEEVPVIAEPVVLAEKPVPEKPWPPHHPLDGLLCGQAKHDLYMRFIPKGKELRRLFQDRQTFFYDDESMPKVYQIFDEGNNSGIRRVSRANETANKEFPWANPAGVSFDSNVKTFRFVQPAGPWLWWDDKKPDGTLRGYAWQHPVGVRFGEVLLVTDAKGFDHTCIVRTRTKRESGRWSMEAYIPFPTEESYLIALRERGYTSPSAAAETIRVDSGHDHNAFVGSGRTAKLWPMPESLVVSLLDQTEFVVAKGLSWREDVVAPTAEGFSVVPNKYAGCMVPVNDVSCMRCHEDVNRTVNLQGERRWRVRGMDGIFSFHPFDPNDLNKFNAQLVNAGLLKFVDGPP